MLIRIGYDIQFDIPSTVPMLAQLHVHPSRDKDLVEPDTLHIEPEVNATEYIDSFGNRCARFVAPPGPLRLHGSALIRDTGLLDQINIYAREIPVARYPTSSSATCSTAAIAKLTASTTSPASSSATSRRVGRG